MADNGVQVIELAYGRSRSVRCSPALKTVTRSSERDLDNVPEPPADQSRMLDQRRGATPSRMVRQTRITLHDGTLIAVIIQTQMVR